MLHGNIIIAVILIIERVQGLQTMKNKASLLVLTVLPILFLQSCASLHSNYQGVYVPRENANENAVESPIVVSGDISDKMYSTYFRVVNFTLENTSNHWARISNVSVDFQDEKLNHSIKIPVGNQIAAWVKSMELKNAITQYNTSLMLSGLVLVGAIAGAQGNSNSQLAGTAMMTAGVGSMVSDDLSNNLDEIQNAKMIPKTHLLSGDFDIPPGMFTKKWILLESPDANNVPVQKIAINFEINGAKKRVSLPIAIFGWR